MNGSIRVGGTFKFKCFDKDGKVKWRENAKNLVPNIGLNLILDNVFNEVSPNAAYYVGLLSSSPTVSAGDTMGSHAGWTEVVNYTETNRPAYNNVRTNQTVSNTASKASFSINAAVTIGGAFLVSDNAKNGTAGTILAEAAFSGGNRSAESGDTLEVTYEFSAADDGA